MKTDIRRIIENCLISKKFINLNKFGEALWNKGFGFVQNTYIFIQFKRKSIGIYKSNRFVAKDIIPIKWQINWEVITWPVVTNSLVSDESSVSTELISGLINSLVLNKLIST